MTSITYHLINNLTERNNSVKAINKLDDNLFNIKWNVRQKEPTTPMDLPYMQRIKFYLQIMDAWPLEELQATYGEKPRKLPLRNCILYFIAWTGCLLAGCCYLVVYTGKLSFFELDHSYITVFMNFVCVQRLTLPFVKSYRNAVAGFVLKLHLFHHKHKSEYALKINNQVNKLCDVYTIFLYIQMYVGALLFNIGPLLSNIQSGVFKIARYNKTSYELAVSQYLPYEIKLSISEYTMVSLLNIFISFTCGSIFCTFDLVMALVAFHMWGHIKILKYNLENFPRPSRIREIDELSCNAVMFTAEESSNVLNMIIENINHHRMIKEVMAQASQAFGIVMCFYYTFHQVSGCILLLKASNSTDTSSLSRYGLLTIIIFEQLIQISIVFELIKSKSETLKDAVYSVPWECMDVKTRKIVLFFLYNVQSPMALKAMGMIPVGVQTMAAILKTSVSYFVMLRTFAEN